MNRGLEMLGLFCRSKRAKHSILLALQECTLGLLLEEKWPHSYAQRETFFLSDNYGGKPIESESVECVCNEAATISTWFGTFMKCCTLRYRSSSQLLRDEESGAQLRRGPADFTVISNPYCSCDAGESDNNSAGP